jgi:hypothetical protein
MQDNLTAKQNDYAVFLPAISGFYATFVGKQRDPVTGPYVDPARFPQGLTDMEQLNWLNDQKALFPYKWSLYSGGHANLDLSKQDWSEDMVRNRDPNTLILGDSGGFQIAKGLWEGEWRDPSSPAVQQKLKDLQGKKEKRKNAKGKEVEVDLAKEYQSLIDAAQKKRDSVLKWLDGISNYGMILDIPTWVIHDKFASAKCGITTLEEAVEATKYNNDYFMRHRRGIANGGTKFLNVLQGANHPDADRWYDIMKEYCDPVKYPDTHFNGWAMGGQNMCDVHLILKRLVAMRYDNLLQEGVHDWMHFLGTSKLEWAVLLTVIQRNIRKYVNPAFTISFDCASPFLATANGQVYFENVFPDNDKWSYRMAPSADDKKYATDTRKWSDGVVTDGIYPRWENSPLSDLFKMKDICYYKPGDVNKNGKEGKTSWDSFSYALLMGHNVWMHLTAVQEANRRFDQGEHPAMMRSSGPGGEYFEDLVEAIFAAPDKDTAMTIIDMYSNYWMEIVGTRGFKGKKALNGNAMFDQLFEVEDSEEVVEEAPEPEFDESKLEHLGE